MREAGLQRPALCKSGRSDGAVRWGHVGFWLNKHFRLYGERHAVPIKRLGEALLCRRAGEGASSGSVLINPSCAFFALGFFFSSFFPSELLSRKERLERQRLCLAVLSLIDS